MLPIAYASSEGSDEPALPRKIASALTAHIHNEGACRGCEFKISRAIEMIGTSGIHVCRSMYPDFVTCEDQPVHRSVSSAPLFLEQNVKHFVGQVLGPNCLLYQFVTGSLGGGVPPRSHPGFGTANSISSRQRDRVIVHGHV